MKKLVQRFLLLGVFALAQALFLAPAHTARGGDVPPVALTRSYGPNLVAECPSLVPNCNLLDLFDEHPGEMTTRMYDKAGTFIGMKIIKFDMSQFDPTTGHLVGENTIKLYGSDSKGKQVITGTLYFPFDLYAPFAVVPFTQAKVDSDPRLRDLLLALGIDPEADATYTSGRFGLYVGSGWIPLDDAVKTGRLGFLESYLHGIEFSCETLLNPNTGGLYGYVDMTYLWN